MKMMNPFNCTACIMDGVSRPAAYQYDTDYQTEYMCEPCYRRIQKIVGNDSERMMWFPYITPIVGIPPGSGSIWLKH